MFILLWLVGIGSFYWLLFFCCMFSKVEFMNSYVCCLVVCMLLYWVFLFLELYWFSVSMYVYCLFVLLVWSFMMSYVGLFFISIYGGLGVVDGVVFVFVFVVVVVGY